MFKINQGAEQLNNLKMSHLTFFYDGIDFFSNEHVNNMAQALFTFFSEELQALATSR